jgi:hypothetical protein
MNYGTETIIDGFSKRKVIALIKKALKESKESQSYMDVFGLDAWIKKNVRSK